MFEKIIETSFVFLVLFNKQIKKNTSVTLVSWIRFETFDIFVVVC